MRIRTAYFAALEGGPPPGPRDPSNEHTRHCFDYIRFGLMCNADMTVEWRQQKMNVTDGEASGVESGIFEGVGVPHGNCVNWVRGSQSLSTPVR